MMMDYQDKIGRRVIINIHDPEHFTKTLGDELTNVSGELERIRNFGDDDRIYLIRLDKPAKCCEAENWPMFTHVWLSAKDFIFEITTTPDKASLTCSAS